MAEKIDLLEPLGVSAATPSTILLAQMAESFRAKRVLDLGTGTGYVGIYLSKRGSRVEAIDISPRAVEVATENAIESGTSMLVYQSDLFGNVKGKFDLIVWNAPVGDAKGSRFFDILKSIIRKTPVIYKMAQYVTYWKYLEERINIDKLTVLESKKFLEVGGVLLMLILDGEESAIASLAREQGYSVEVVDSSALRESVKAKFLVMRKL